MNYTSVQLHDFVRRFDDLTHLIETAKDKAHHDNISDIQVLGLEKMESEIDTLCADIKAAPTDVAKNTQSLMAQMISRLDDLAQALQALKANAEHKLSESQKQGH
jgi:altronate dehydratase